MSKNILVKTFVIIGSIFIGIYALFLVLPFIINPIIQSYIPQITQEIDKASGLKTSLDGVKVVTTPKFTAGLRVGKFTLQTPQSEPILKADDFQLKASLLPLLKKQIRIDLVALKNAEANIQFNKDGSLYIEKFFPVIESTENSNENNITTNVLPFGLKLSNHLPDIRIGGYNVILTDGVNKYTLSGDATEITDFVINKSIKVKASGKMILRDKEQFNYNIKVLNKIMPDIELDDLVFAPPEEDKEEVKKESQPIDIIGILDGIYESNLRANANADLVIRPNDIRGFANIENLSIINLPQSNAKLNFKGEKIEISSDIYTANQEVSNISGLIKTGKNPNIDMNFKSQAQIANILRIIKEIALIFDFKDLQTLTANGNLDANFNIKSNMKTVKSNGYLRVPSADVYYGLYKIGIDSINADVRLDNNNVDIKNIGFSVFNQPLKFYGTISENAVSDLHLVADKLSLKGLLVAFGQAVLLKENNVDGSISMKADITGRLDKINPVLKLNVDNINIKNIPSNTILKAPATVVNITSDGKTFMGNATSNNIKIINPAVTVSAPSIKANIREKEIEITQTPITIDKINTTVSGKISNYLTQKIGLNFITTGDIKSALIGDLNLAKQTLNLNYSTTNPSTIIIPMFDKSNMTFVGNIDIVGNMMNPILKGVVSIPTLNIPEIPVSMTNLDIKLNGPIAKGSGSVQKFTSGGIEAENITSDFVLKGNDFYLNNMKGSTFGGKFAGNLIYNLANTKTTIDFSGDGLNAERAIHGAVGIKNALTGTLGFNTKLTLLVKDYEEMMRSLKGNLKFSVKNGSFGAIGRIENLLNANNIVSNGILKTTVDTLINSAGLADTAKYESIDGALTFNNGWANINPIKTSAPLMTYFITGKYNLINGTTNVVILGRLDASVVAKLGIVGELSADKLFGYIPKFGSLTANIVNALTANPKGENIAAIPALTNGSTVYKDFKVTFNGGLESTSSIKSFKWLTEVDTSAIETKSVKETLNDLKTSVGTDYQNTIKSVTDAISGSKEQWNTSRDQLKNSANEILNLFK